MNLPLRLLWYSKSNTITYEDTFTCYCCTCYGPPILTYIYLQGYVHCSVVVLTVVFAITGVSSDIRCIEFIKRCACWVTIKLILSTTIQPLRHLWRGRWDAPCIHMTCLSAGAVEQEFSGFATILLQCAPLWLTSVLLLIVIIRGLFVIDCCTGRSS